MPLDDFVDTSGAGVRAKKKDAAAAARAAREERRRVQEQQGNAAATAAKEESATKIQRAARSLLARAQSRHGQRERWDAEMAAAGGNPAAGSSMSCAIGSYGSVGQMPTPNASSSCPR